MTMEYLETLSTSIILSHNSTLLPCRCLYLKLRLSLYATASLTIYQRLDRFNRIFLALNHLNFETFQFESENNEPRSLLIKITLCPWISV